MRNEHRRLVYLGAESVESPGCRRRSGFGWDPRIHVPRRLHRHEAGQRRVVLEKLDPEFLRSHDPVALTVALAQWLATQLSIWYEIATWYGWAFFPGFPEKASAFSPEDLYSNVLGTHIAAATAFGGGVRTEVLYEHSADAWLRAVV